MCFFVFLFSSNYWVYLFCCYISKFQVVFITTRNRSTTFFHSFPTLDIVTSMAKDIWNSPTWLGLLISFYVILVHITLPFFISFYGCFAPITTTSSLICFSLVFTCIVGIFFSILSTNMSIFSKTLVVISRYFVYTSNVASATFSSLEIPRFATPF